MNPKIPEGVQILGEVTPAFAEILTPGALAFVAKLQRHSEIGVRNAAETASSTDCARSRRGTRFSAGNRSNPRWRLDLCSNSAGPGGSPVEITGPTDRKMVINALNSGAKVFMADFEDANSPTWQNMVDGQINLRDAIRRTIQFRQPGRENVPAQGETRRADGASTRVAFVGKTSARRRQADVRRAF